jgi:GTP-binding protein Era|tara:strand:- start:10582 stop:11481 length:900 start_codon:yes stop_codon:yes gene_type:complete
MNKKFKCGYVAVIGRPNVGKSTLINHLLGQKLNITSRKPQTTRHAILGIRTDADQQVIFVDTPGQHIDEPKAINRYMNKVARAAMRDVELVIFVIDRLKWTREDEQIMHRLEGLKAPLIVTINKTDKLAGKDLLLPHVQDLSTKLPDAEFMPISALQGDNLDKLYNLIASYLPESEAHFAEDQVTDRSTRFVVAEIVREKILRQLGEEVPYASTVEIERFEQQGSLIEIHALILVEREGQKRIIIGEAGTRLKSVGTEARLDIEKLLDSRVLLKLWVKVKSNWSDDERALQSLGYQESN